jgi:hypothetical protein
MDSANVDIQQLVDQPRESLAVELKNWINPDEPAGIAKIVKTAIAMRNNNGGYLIVGFNNKSLEPDFSDVPSDVVERYHPDKIQGLVTKYASAAFEVDVQFPERGGQKFPVVKVASGVRCPVAAKLDLENPEKGKPKLIAKNTVYVRSLLSNHTPSTTEVPYNDWERVVGVCFENREAEIGAFLRRHLFGASPKAIKESVEVIMETLSEKGLISAAVAQRTSASGNSGLDTQSNEDERILYSAAEIVLEDGERRFERAKIERKIHPNPHGVWEVACRIVGDLHDHGPTQEFFRFLMTRNPNYTGWPIWMDSSGFSDESCRPYVREGAWEALIYSDAPNQFGHLDFWCIKPDGGLFNARAHQDDIGNSAGLDPLKVLDFSLVIARTAEAIAVTVQFARAWAESVASTSLSFAFKWDRLRGRQIASWASPYRMARSSQFAMDDSIQTQVILPGDLPLPAIGQYVKAATDDLFHAFGGLDIPIDVVDDITQEMLRRRPGS